MNPFVNRIAYRSQYNYQLKADHTYQLSFAPAQTINTEFICFDIRGKITLWSGYAWDGPSGPVFHTASLMRASLIHDALYQLMREGHLDHKQYRKLADLELRKIGVADGVFHFRAVYIYLAVRLFGAPFADPAKAHPPLTAP